MLRFTLLQNHDNNEHFVHAHGTVKYLLQIKFPWQFAVGCNPNSLKFSHNLYWLQMCLFIINSTTVQCIVKLPKQWFICTT